jgi:hypothetical protein
MERDEIYVLSARLTVDWANTVDEAGRLRVQAAARDGAAAVKKRKVELMKLPCFAALDAGLATFILAYLELPDESRGAVVHYFASLKTCESARWTLDSIRRPNVNLNELPDDVRTICEHWDRVPEHVANMLRGLLKRRVL